MARTKELDMLNGALLPKLMMFSLPLALTGILQLLFNAADVIVVGKFAGSTSLAAVGATSALVNLLTGAFIGISVGVHSRQFIVLSTVYESLIGHVIRR